jgi:hypothetical protein
MNSRELLDTWRERAKKTQKAHFESSSVCTRNHYILGGIVVALSTIVGSTFLGDIFLKVDISSAISIFVAALAAVQTSLRLPERAEKHRVVAAKLSDLKKRIEKLEVFTTENELEEKIEQIRIDWFEILKDAPTSLRRVWRKMRLKREKKS